MKENKSLIWWNLLGNTKRNDLALTYYGVDCSMLLDEEILKIYTEENRYYVEFTNGLFLSLFPAPNQHQNREHKTLQEALDYILVDCGVKEVTLKC